MSMAQYGSLLILSDDEREELTHWAQSRTLPSGDVFRARLILALAEGLSYCEIERKLNTSSPTVARWRKRFEKRRMEGLSPQHTASSAGWQHPLELPQTGQGGTRQQIDGAACLGTGTVETASVGSLHGQRRSGVREQGVRHHRPISESAAACRRVLRRREDGHSGPGPLGPGAAAFAGTRRAPRV